MTVGTDVKFTATATGNPSPTDQWFRAVSGSNTFLPIQGATSLDIGPATLAENGNRYEAVFTNGVGAPVTSAPATLTVTNPTPVGAISGSQANALSSYNLTTLGASDWAHWGRGGTYANFDHKNSGGSQISNVTKVGAGGRYGGYAENARAATWTNGTPTTSTASDHGYIWSNGAVGSGFSFTAPADTTTRTLLIYAGGINTTSSLRAHLSDGSAADYFVTAQGKGLYSNFYTITYRAGSAGKHLVITLLKTGNLNGRTDGSADLIAAMLR